MATGIESQSERAPSTSSMHRSYGIRTSFLKDTMDLQDVNLDQAWIGFDSTLFLRFKLAMD